MIILYNILLVVLAPLWIPWMYWRASRRKRPVNWDQRFGRLDLNLRKGSNRLWIHAVSVGEVIAAVPILKDLRTQIPDSETVLSVTTSSGFEAAEKLEPGVVDHLIYFPIDIPRFVFAALVYVRPSVVVLMETELWLNFLSVANQMGLKTMVINGRISDKHLKRMRWIRPYYKALFQRLDKVYTQTDEDRARFLVFGAQHAETVGNCKFDQAAQLETPDGQVVRAEFGIPADAPVLVVGSTRGDLEEEFVISAIERLEMPDLQVIHAPRHLERVTDLAAKVRVSLGEVALRSKGETGRYLILDTYGELGRAYAAADVVIVGGGFDKLGGQNLIQPLALGKPVLHGPHMQNFRDVAALSEKAGASIVCETSDELLQRLRELFIDGPKRHKMGQAARNLVHSQLGSSHKYAQLIELLAATAPKRKALVPSIDDSGSGAKPVSKTPAKGKGKRR